MFEREKRCWGRGGGQTDFLEKTQRVFPFKDIHGFNMGIFLSIRNEPNIENTSIEVNPPAFCGKKKKTDLWPHVLTLSSAKTAVVNEALKKKKSMYFAKVTVCSDSCAALCYKVKKI